MGKLRSFLSLPSADRRQALRALVALPVVLVGLRVFGYARCHRWLRRRASRPPKLEAGSGGGVNEILRERTRRVVWAVWLAERNLAGELFWGWAPFGSVQCLARSLTLWWLLARDGVPAQVRVGVRREGAGIAAHAWVEVMGHPLDDNDIGRRYAPFDRSLLEEPHPIARAEAPRSHLPALTARDVGSETSVDLTE